MIPFALVIGLAVVQSGLPPLVGWSSSPIIFGGAAQLTVLTLLGAGTATGAVIAAGLVVQARHLMYSAALAPTFQDQPRWFRWLAPYALIDQMFALGSFYTESDPVDFRSYYIGSGAVYILCWNITTAIGLLVGPLVPESWGIGFAVPVMFVALVVMGLNRWPKVAAAVAAGIAAYLAIGMPNRSGLLVGSFVGVVVGFIVSRSRR